MKKFGKWFVRGVLREKYSALWVWACVGSTLALIHIGWWALLCLIIAAIPITALEVWWNEYADDYDDLETDA